MLSWCWTLSFIKLLSKLFDFWVWWKLNIGLVYAETGYCEEKMCGLEDIVVVLTNVWSYEWKLRISKLGDFCYAVNT